MILQKIYRSRLSRAPERGSAATVHTTEQIVEDSVGIAEQFTESARHHFAGCDRDR